MVKPTALAAERARHLLVRQLRAAYSGELAAGYAYRGHWRSSRLSTERDEIAAIEADEWHHRRLVGSLLHDLGRRPSLVREAIFACVGRTLGLLCHVAGWFAPMYGAGKLESHNVKEYEDAAHYAVACGRGEMVACLVAMAEVEWDHERYFRAKAASHWLARLLPLWKEIPPRATIRQPFLTVLENEGYPAHGVAAR